MNTHWNVCGKCPSYFFKCDSQVGITLFFNLSFSIILFADWKTFFMAGSLISHLGQLVALSSGGNWKKNLRSLIDHGGTAALCLFSLLGVFYVWESEMNFFFIWAVIILLILLFIWDCFLTEWGSTWMMLRDLELWKIGESLKWTPGIILETVRTS